MVKFFITHGDGLSKGDTGYKIIKKILRSPVNHFCIRLSILILVCETAQGSSKKSRLHTDDRRGVAKHTEVKKDILTHGSGGMREFASKKIGEGIDFVIMGRIHKPLYI